MRAKIEIKMKKNNKRAEVRLISKEKGKIPFVDVLFVGSKRFIFLLAIGSVS